MNLSTSINVSDALGQISSAPNVNSGGGTSVFSEILKTEISTNAAQIIQSGTADAQTQIADLLGALFQTDGQQQEDILASLLGELKKNSETGDGDILAMLQYLADGIASMYPTDVQPAPEMNYSPDSATRQTSEVILNENSTQFSSGNFAQLSSQQSDENVQTIPNTESNIDFSVVQTAQQTVATDNELLPLTKSIGQYNDVNNVTQNVTDANALIEKLNELITVLRNTDATGGSFSLERQQTDVSQGYQTMTTDAVMMLKNPTATNLNVTDELKMLLGSTDEPDDVKLFVPETASEKPKDEQNDTHETFKTVKTNDSVFTAENNGYPVKTETSVPLNTDPVKTITRITDEITAKLTTLKNGETSFEMTLNPESLGKITVKLVTVGEKVAVEIVAEKPETAQLLQGRADELQLSLKQNGVELESYQTVVQTNETYQNSNFGENRKHRNPQYQQPQGEENDDDISFSELLAIM